MTGRELQAALVLEDGTMLHGKGFGAIGRRMGELVFNTSMMGYQEALTDPSYAGQTLLMSYPLIGNYGINDLDYESPAVHPEGLAVRELSPDHQHREAVSSLDAWLRDAAVPGIHGIDTRMLVRRIRQKGVMPCALEVKDGPIDPKALLRWLDFDYSAVDFVSKVSARKPSVVNPQGSKRIALIDYGVKGGIVRELASRGGQVHILPFDSTAEDVLSMEPDGILLSNGPGDPSILKDAHSTIRLLGGKAPMFGICLGHQLMSHAFGSGTFKLKFGHRGSNHAVVDTRSGRCHITSQNHGFASLGPAEGFHTTLKNANDGTIEGMEDPDRAMMCVQFHPEASPGPRDTRYLFDQFMRMM